MCLMCIHYLDSCDKPECIARAKEYVKTDRTSETYYRGRTGTELFLYQGYGLEACEHILAQHGPGCEMLTEQDTCNCYFDKEDGVWIYD